MLKIAGFDNKEYQRKWRERNRNKLREYYRDYRVAHPELTDYHANYYRTHKTEIKAQLQKPATKARMRSWRNNNRAKRNSWRRNWCERNPEAANAIEARRREKRKPQKQAYDHAYRQNNPDRCREIIEKSKQKKPELYKTHAVKSALRRRTRIRQLPTENISLTFIIQRDRSRCHLCLKLVTVNDRSFDHLIPVCREGATAEWNLMLSHLQCNKRRGTRQILEAETTDHAEKYIAQRNSEKV